MRGTNSATLPIFTFCCMTCCAATDVHFTAVLSYTFPELCPVYSSAGDLVRPCSNPSTRTIYGGHAAFQLLDTDLLFSITAPSGDWDFYILKPSGENVQAATCAYYGYERVPVPPPPTYVPGDEIVVDVLEPLDPGEPVPPSLPPGGDYFEIVRFIQPCTPAGALHLSENDVAELIAGTWQIEGRRPTPSGINSALAPVFRGAILPLDTDADGVPDFRDACENTTWGALINADGCSIEQLAPCGAPWKSHGEYVNHARRVIASFLQQGLISPSVAQTLIRDAANSNCGRPSLPR